mmetsp:Transcript_41273/g.109270  ORF Transcript_41273/g.109270 Transcript_41273/m.109270 type:complete len:227 (+) Transcript_41273:1681-2361(+)
MHTLKPSNADWTRPSTSWKTSTCSVSGPKTLSNVKLWTSTPQFRNILSSTRSKASSLPSTAGRTRQYTRMFPRNSCNALCNSIRWVSDTLSCSVRVFLWVRSSSLVPCCVPSSLSWHSICLLSVSTETSSSAILASCWQSPESIVDRNVFNVTSSARFSKATRQASSTFATNRPLAFSSSSCAFSIWERSCCKRQTSIVFVSSRSRAALSSSSSPFMCPFIPAISA